SVLWTSANRTDWSPVELPEPFLTTHKLTLLSVIDTTVYGIGQTTASDAAGSITTAGGTEVLGRPELRDGDRPDARALTGHDDELLLVATPGPEGEFSPVASFAASDRGATWPALVELGASTTAFAGVV